MKAISYALFGYGKPQHDSCFSFASYLRGLTESIRFNQLIYPDWVIIVHMDRATYEPFKELFDRLPIEIVICPEAELTKAMLWRMKPIFTAELGKWKYSHVLCRDLDSPVTYREAQAVQYWINKDKAMHAITDSVSHDLPLLGGMIGVRPDYFTERVGCQNWEELMAKANGIDFNIKGADQTFLNNIVYPCFARQGNDSITQHYFNGHPNTFLSDYHTCLCPPPSGHERNCHNNLEIDLPIELKESNSVCGHIGASGAYQTAKERFLRKYSDRFVAIKEAESLFPDIFYWIKDNSI